MKRTRTEALAAVILRAYLEGKDDAIMASMRKPRGLERLPDAKAIEDLLFRQADIDDAVRRLRVRALALAGEFLSSEPLIDDMPLSEFIASLSDTDKVKVLGLIVLLKKSPSMFDAAIQGVMMRELANHMGRHGAEIGRKLREKLSKREGSK